MKLDEVGQCDSCHCMTKRICGKCGAVVTMDTDVDVIKNNKRLANLQLHTKIKEVIEEKRQKNSFSENFDPRVGFDTLTVNAVSGYLQALSDLSTAIDKIMEER